MSMEPNFEPAGEAPIRRKTKELELRMHYASVFSTPEGGVVLRDLMQCFGFDPETRIENPNPRLDPVLEGSKEVLRRILAMTAERRHIR